jgi:hypothetical protein
MGRANGLYMQLEASSTTDAAQQQFTNAYDIIQQSILSACPWAYKPTRKSHAKAAIRDARSWAVCWRQVIRRDTFARGRGWHEILHFMGITHTDICILPHIINEAEVLEWADSTRPAYIESIA